MIINADLGQCYLPLTVGTAKPDWRSYPFSSHLFDIHTEPREYTVVEWRKHVLGLIFQIHAAGKTPIIVGGSVFYIHSLFYPPKPLPTSSKLHELIDLSLPTHELYKKLLVIDPQRAHELHLHDAYRIKRAIEIWNTTGQKPSDCKPTFDFCYKAKLYILLPEPALLKERIEQRCKEMIKHGGWIEECEKLIGTEWESFSRRKGFIGYSDIFDYLAESVRSDINQLITKISIKTHQYAKHQRAFLRKTIKSLSADNCSGIEVLIANGKNSSPTADFLGA